MDDRTPNEITDDAADIVAESVTHDATPPPADDATAKATEYLAGWQRAQADYANLRRDTEAKFADLRVIAVAGFVETLLPTIDAFRKAMEQPPECADDAVARQWVEGIGHIRSQLESVLTKAGVSVIDAPGVSFDPALHEAMLQRPADDRHASGTVVEVLEPGYRMHDRVLRAAKVVVAE